MFKNLSRRQLQRVVAGGYGRTYVRRSSKAQTLSWIGGGASRGGWRGGVLVAVLILFVPITIYINMLRDPARRDYFFSSSPDDSSSMNVGIPNRFIVIEAGEKK